MWGHWSHKLEQIRGIGSLRYTALKDLNLPSRISMLEARANPIDNVISSYTINSMQCHTPH